MKLVFLGTRGEIEIRTPAHQRHTSLEVAYRGRRIMIDAGLDWRGLIDEIDPAAIVLTHAHGDHAGGLRGGAPCPVYACPETWECLSERRFPVHRRTIEHRAPVEICGITFEAFPVEHSVRAPAVGYRITAGRVSIFHVPDVVSIPDRRDALRGCRMYIGDGASVTRPIVRRRDGRLIGHAPIVAQLSWLEEEGVPRAVFTHCGSEILRADPSAIQHRLDALAAERGSVTASFATDGMELVLR